MAKKKTDELEKILTGTHTEDLSTFFVENADELIAGSRPFTQFMRQRLGEKNMRWQDVFLEADIPERYGYKLISGEKTTRKRDVIYRICYAAGFSREEIRNALRLYGMPDLYARDPRDAVLIHVLKDTRRSAAKLNRILTQNGMEPLETAGGEI